MKNFSFIAVALVFFAGCSNNADDPVSVQNVAQWDEVARGSQDALFLIGYRFDSTQYEGEQVRLVGTGFAIDTNLIITNAHVVNALLRLDDSPVPIAVRAGENVSAASILPLTEFKIHPLYTGSYASADLAILRVHGKIPSMLTLASNEEMDSLRAGTSIATMGFPGETSVWSLSRPTPSFKEGTISSIHTLDKPDLSNPYSYLIQHNLDLTGGTSGSPIFNSEGKVIAVNNSGFFLTSIGYGITASYIDTLRHISEYDSFCTFETPKLRRFTDGGGSLPAMVDGMRVGKTDFEQLKAAWGYDYRILGENDSLRLIEYSDYSTYRVLVVIEKADWYERSANICVLFLISNIPGQSRVNSFSHYIYDDILVGASKTNIQLHFGICNTRRTHGSFCAYEYANSDSYYYSRRGLAFVFMETDEYCSGIAVFDHQSAEMPHLIVLDSSFVSRYASGDTTDLLPPQDTTMTLKYPSGVTMSERTYKDGSLDGTLREYDENGVLRLQGQFTDGRKDGVFERFDSSGTLLWVKTFSNDTLNGLSAEFYSGSANDTSKVWMYQSGQLNGAARVYYESGGLARSEYWEDGLLQDTAKSYYSDGKLKIVAVYDSGQLDGTYREYFTEGQIKIQAEYADGLKNGLYLENRIVGDSLHPRYERSYENDRLEGISKTYQSSGNQWYLQEETPYKNNKKEGTEKVYRTSGILFAEIDYKAGVRHGVSKYYYDDGVSVQYKVTYEYGKKTREVEYNLDGTVKSEKTF